MDVSKMVQRMVNNLEKVQDSCSELSLFHIHPKKVSRLNYFAKRAALLREEIEEDYDL